MYYTLDTFLSLEIVFLDNIINCLLNKRGDRCKIARIIRYLITVYLDIKHRQINLPVKRYNRHRIDTHDIFFLTSICIIRLSSLPVGHDIHSKSLRDILARLKIISIKLREICAKHDNPSLFINVKLKLYKNFKIII